MWWFDTRSFDIGSASFPKRRCVVHVMISWYHDDRNALRSQKFKSPNNRCGCETSVVEQIPGDYQYICSVFNDRGS